MDSRVVTLSFKHFAATIGLDFNGLTGNLEISILWQRRLWLCSHHNRVSVWHQKDGDKQANAAKDSLGVKRSMVPRQELNTDRGRTVATIRNNVAERNTDGGAWLKTDIIYGSNNALVLVVGIGDRVDLTAEPVGRHAAQVQNQGWERDSPVGGVDVNLGPHNTGGRQEEPADDDEDFGSEGLDQSRHVGDEGDDSGAVDDVGQSRFESRIAEDILKDQGGVEEHRVQVGGYDDDVDAGCDQSSGLPDVRGHD